MRDANDEFWRLPIVLQKSGLSKTQLYRRIREPDQAKNPFPPGRPFRDGRGVFWTSSDVHAWQDRETGSVEDLLG